MTVPKINSAHGSDTRNILNRAIDLINVQGKSIQDLVAEGQLTPTQYGQLVSIVNGNVKKGSITADDLDKNNFQLDQTHLSDELKQQITGDTPINAVPADKSITTEKLADGSITQTTLDKMLSEKTTFNKYNLTNFNLGGINGSTGEFYGIENRVISDIFPVKKGTILTTAHQDYIGARVLLYDVNKNFIKDAGYFHEYEFENDCFCIIESGYTNGSVIENASVFDNYVLIKKKFDVDDFSSSLKKMDFLKYDEYENYERIFGKEFNISGFETGVIRRVDGGISSSDNRVVSKVIKVYKKTKIVTNDTSTKGMIIATFNNSKELEFYTGTNYIQEYDIDFDGYIILQSAHTDESIVTNTSFFDNKFSIISFDPDREDLHDINAVDIYFVNYWGKGSIAAGTENNRANTPMIKAEQGVSFSMINAPEMDGLYVYQYDINGEEISRSGYYSTYTTSADGYVRLQLRYSDQRIINDLSEFNNIVRVEQGTSVNNNYLSGNFTDYYHSPSAQELMNSADYDLTTTKIEDVYEIYDNLVALYPHLIERNLLGYGGNAGNISDETLPIYEYHFKSLKRQNMYHKNAETILITTSVHGNEQAAVWGLAKFMEQLMTEWQNHSNLESVLSNVDFKIIPIAGPFHYNNNQRLRAGINLNRNFSHVWETYSNNDKGSSPYSELEAAIVRDWLIENKGSFAYVDFHNTPSIHGPSYIATQNNALREVYGSLIRRLSNKWHYKYGEIDEVTTGEVHGKLSIGHDNQPTAHNEAKNAGIPNYALIEAPRDFNGVDFTDEVIERNVEVIGNWIIALLDAHSKNYI